MDRGYASQLGESLTVTETFPTLDGRQISEQHRFTSTTEPPRAPTPTNPLEMLYFNWVTRWLQARTRFI